MHAMEEDILEATLWFIPHVSEVLQELSEQKHEQQATSGNELQEQSENNPNIAPWISDEDRVVWSLSLGAVLVYMLWHHTY